ncbi:uncharacterized [Lates japonicus]
MTASFSVSSQVDINADLRTRRSLWLMAFVPEFRCGDAVPTRSCLNVSTETPGTVLELRHRAVLKIGLCWPLNCLECSLLFWSVW